MALLSSRWTVPRRFIWISIERVQNSERYDPLTWGKFQSRYFPLFKFIWCRILASTELKRGLIGNGSTLWAWHSPLATILSYSHPEQKKMKKKIQLHNHLFKWNFSSGIIGSDLNSKSKWSSTGICTCTNDLFRGLLRGICTF